MCWSRYSPVKAQRCTKKAECWDIITLCGAILIFLLAMDLVTLYGLRHFYVWDLLVFSIFVKIIFAAVEAIDPKMRYFPSGLKMNRDFVAAGVSMFFIASAFVSTLVYIPQLFIKVKDSSAFGAGATFLPLMVFFSAVAYIPVALYERLGAKILICAGALGVCVGLFLLSDVVLLASYNHFLPGLLTVGNSIEIYSPMILTTAISVVEPSDFNLAGSIISVFTKKG